MKIFINKILFLLAISVFLGSCDDEVLTVLNPNAAVIVALSQNEVVLEKDNIGQEALTVTWAKPDYGYSAAASYQVLLDLASGDFSAAQVISTGQALSKTFETEELNKILVGLGVEPGVATPMAIKVKSLLGSSTNISSEVNSLMVTAYADALDLSSPWGIVGSAFNDWGNGGPDAPFYKIQGEPNKYVAYVTLLDGEWKIRKDNDWAVNYGDDGGDGTLEPGGANIPATAGTYKVVFDEANLTYTVEAYTWGIVGSAFNDWGATPDAPLSYDPYTDTWRTQVKLLDGEFKIRQNNDWAVNYGDTGLDGTLDAGGDNIPVTAGYYEIIVNFNDFTYTLESTDVYGVVGSGYNDWGAFDDFPFTKDFSKEDVYYIKGITLLDGEIKYRVNNDWGTNYGDDGNDGILELNGANIPVTAGVYDIVLDFSNPSIPTHTITAK
jgi:starch-binding outer membrane protein SusE/F